MALSTSTLIMVSSSLFFPNKAEEYQIIQLKSSHLNFMLL